MVKQQTTKLPPMPESTCPVPTYLYKILSLDDWKKSSHTVHLPAMDGEFIHFSTENQLQKTVEKYWSDAAEYIVLKIETAKIQGRLLFETNPEGTTKYYHAYNGAIPLTAISEIKTHKKESIPAQLRPKGCRA